MIPTVDTNILLYSIDDRDPVKKHGAGAIADALKAGRAPLALQVCGEFYHAATRRLKRPPWVAAQAARNLLTSFPIFAATAQSMARAFAEAASGRLSFWDANLLSSADLAGCTHVISEDMADGLQLGRLEVVHPFENGEPSQRIRELLRL